MSLADLRSLLLWCSLINYGLLVFWALLVFLARGWLQRIHARFYRMSPEQFDLINYSAIVIYKLLIIVFNIVPYIALAIIGSRA